MPKCKGIFHHDDIAVSLKRLELKDAASVAVPSTVRYFVPSAIANKFKDARGHLLHEVDGHKHSTLVHPVLTKITYMDVGRWGGDGPAPEDAEMVPRYRSTPKHWGRRRDFGIVCGRLSVLCTYTNGADAEYSSKARIGWNPDVARRKPTQRDPETVRIGKTRAFKKILPLLNHLSSLPRLGTVTVTRAMLGETGLAQAPKDDAIYVFLGDLHVPVIVEKNRTYLGSAPKPAIGRDAPSQHLMRGRFSVSLARRKALLRLVEGLKGDAEWVRSLPKRQGKQPAAPATIFDRVYDRLVEEAKVIGSGGRTVSDLGHAGYALYDLAEVTAMDQWDNETRELHEVEDWFEMYHGKKDKKGADIFEDAGKDLEDWLGLLISYQSSSDRGAPVRLLQLGDLFDFWIGLKCAFGFSTVSKDWLSAWHPTPAAAELVKYWKREVLQNSPHKRVIDLLLNSDKERSGKKRINPVFLYGNHDNYLGTVFGAKSKFREDPGLAAEHGHEADLFNADDTAKLGYLLTQAAFVDPEGVRNLENPLSLLIAERTNGIGGRLQFMEHAVDECLRDWLDGTSEQQKGTKPRMSFVMGHTHEPVLQEIVVMASVGRDPPVSEAPENVLVPLGKFRSLLWVSVQFLQVDILGIDEKSAERWTLKATVREVPELDIGPGPISKGFERILLDDAVVVPLTPSEVSGQEVVKLLMHSGSKLEIRVDLGGGRTVSQAVGAQAWGGTRTLEYRLPSGGCHYKVTFELVWGDYVD
jgi:UDP-2,3-diacylglucosamine pyrophosphatase LpxH